MSVLQTRGLDIGWHVPGAWRTFRRAPLRLAAGLDLKLAAGELICLLGPNGAGKSTLLRTLAGLQAPLAGEIRLGGRKLRSLSHRQRARLRAFLPGGAPPDVGMLRARELVALGRYPHSGWPGRLTERDEMAVDAALEAVDAQEFAWQPFDRLSDGQRQKLLIARALAQEPQVLLLDEPTAWLDIRRRTEIMGLLAMLAREQGCAVLTGTHELALALRHADRIWLLPGDNTLTIGTPGEPALESALQDAFGAAFETVTAPTRSPRCAPLPARRAP